MDIPKEAWIILYVFNEPSDWVGSFPSEHYQQYYTDTRNGLPTHFDSYKEAVERAEREYLYNYIVVPIAGEQAMNLQKENERLCNIPNVSNQRELLCAFFKYFRDNGEANIGMTIEEFVDGFLSAQ